MPESIEKHDQSSQERPSKRQLVSVEPEEPDSFKRPRLDANNLSEKGPPISKEELFDDWFTVTDWSRSRKMPKKLPQFPTPDATAQSLNPASTTTSCLVDDTAIDNLKNIIRGLENEGEEEVRSRLGAYVIPGYNFPSDHRLRVVHGQLWNKAVAVPLDSSFVERPLPLPLPLPKPKPDTTFSFSKAAFDQFQLATLQSLEKGNASSFAAPYQDLRFPFIVIEFKSQAKNGTIHVANNQAVGAGAVALNGFLELMKRGPGLDDSELNKLLFFSVSMDQYVAHINMEWIGKNKDTKQHSFHLEQLRALPLRYGDSIQLLIRAIKNIQDHAVNDTLKRLVKALNAYREKIMEKNNADSVKKPHGPPLPFARNIFF